ncbi:peptidoglycan DD-metalloendopeptidase family protein [Zafaria sp. Z1313]|uniref:peptidoglycan DD-metalloendopeptidase family protein n=1 Tax=unclassified Zafaria TaxID=2828765 RepID=UPI002E7A8E74|nr:peptidoglycan DD-metalloendopeptidase family protein [Zafaria sp. J156]MEE1622179.1 peptidoglycan DD-metalloendopeptidase family protein [Zafaria sp. J156]
MAESPRCPVPQRALSGALATLLVLALGSSGAHADELDNRKDKIEQNIDSLESDLEFLDADIQKTAAELKSYQAQLPAAQQALAEAQGRVQTASDEVAALGQRVAAAQQTRDQINRQIADDADKLEETRKIIGQIATQAYKRGGMSSNLSLFLEASADGNLASGMDLADQALRSQNAALDRLSQQHATDRNAQVRLVAVEEEIRGLKIKADAALVKEQAARDEAAESKRHVDSLISKAESISRELQAKRPQIQEQIQAHEAEHAQVLAEIKERQERLKREAEERRRREAEARKKAEAEAKARQEAADRARRERAADAAKKQREADAAAARAKDARDKEAASSGSSSSWGLRSPAASGGYITSGFGWRPTPAGTIDYGGRGGYVHAGVDWGFGGSCGAPIYAAAAGEVWFASRSGSSGNKVTVSHGVVNGHALATNYHHMSYYTVAPGQNVSRGQVIGYVGSTGNSTGCHLHFETILDGQAVNPLGLL